MKQLEQLIGLATTECRHLTTKRHVRCSPLDWYSSTGFPFWEAFVVGGVVAYPSGHG
jgi:hypothetical protein